MAIPQQTPSLFVDCKWRWQPKTSSGLTKVGSIQAYVGKWGSEFHSELSEGERDGS